MTKVNEGVFIFLAAGLALLSVARNSFLKVYGFWTLAVAGLFLPYLLMRPMLYTPSALSYCVFSTCGIAVAVLMALQFESGAIPNHQSHVRLCIVGWGGRRIPGPFLPAARHIAVHHDLHDRAAAEGFAALWYAPLETRLTVTQLGIAILPIPLAYVYSKRVLEWSLRLDPWLPLLKFMTGAGLISLFYLGHVFASAEDRAGVSLDVAAPPDNELDRSTVFGRTFLALLMAFHLLYAFPCAAAK